MSITKDLTQFSEAELAAELERRKKEAEEKKAKEEQAQRDFLIKLLRGPSGIDIINFVTPAHGRTSCTDISPVNGTVVSGRELPRCNRCYLLNVRTGKEDFWNLDVDFSIISTYDRG